MASLRGSCQCGRNQYAIQIPSTSSGLAQIIFDSDVYHRISTAAPLSAFIRVPLLWFHSEVFPFFPDETRSTIRRQYAHPAERHTQRSFCGYCGTQLSYWSEQPLGEADYIQLTLGSLLTEDLHNLQELGLLPDDAEPDEMEIVASDVPGVPDPGRGLTGRDITSIPWFDSLISGSRLGNIHTTKSVRQSRDGLSRVEFEVTEWTADDDDDNERDASESSTSTPGKRKRLDTDDKINRMSTPSAP
ncbi:hypothetical protein F5Y03DRAFT_208780 [Xylaria venustula]|nr:hypothetical protein F5Y03DRAFT_208780 [Xylaria venustula]